MLANKHRLGNYYYFGLGQICLESERLGIGLHLGGREAFSRLACVTYVGIIRAGVVTEYVAPCVFHWFVFRPMTPMLMDATGVGMGSRPQARVGSPGARSGPQIRVLGELISGGIGNVT